MFLSLNYLVLRQDRYIKYNKKSNMDLRLSEQLVYCSRTQISRCFSLPAFVPVRHPSRSRERGLPPKPGNMAVVPVQGPLGGTLWK
jgi:hypothetical protein